MAHKKIMIVTWNDYGIYVKDLAMQIEREGKEYTDICGIPRGGLPIATVLSYYFDIPLTSVHKIHSKTLIVDDICDSGGTIMKVLERCKTFVVKPDVATIFLRTTSNYQPLYWCEKVNNLWWVDFPYEYSDRPDTVSKVTNS